MKKFNLFYKLLARKIWTLAMVVAHVDTKTVENFNSCEQRPGRTPKIGFTYNKRKSIETIKELQKANEILKETKEELEISKKEAMEDKLAMEEAHRITHNMLQELPSALVIVDKQLKVVQANKVLIDLLGKDAKEIAEVIPGLLGADLKGLIPFEIQKLFSFVLKSGENILNRDILLNGEIYTLSIFVIKKGEIAGAVFRNLQQPEIQKEQVIGRITDVIDKNLEMVQKIGFLLGEGAAETEQMLNSILQSYKQSLNKENQAIQINPLNKK
jgi:PAS domain-containing protein